MPCSIPELLHAPSYQQKPRHRISAKSGFLFFCIKPTAAVRRLEPGHATERTVLPRQQFIGTALLRHFPIRQDNAMVGGLHCPHPVSNDRHSLSSQQAGQGSTHFGLLLDVQESCGILQQDDGSALQQYPVPRQWRCVGIRLLRAWPHSLRLGWHSLEAVCR